MNPLIMKLIGSGLWLNSAWDFYVYFLRGEIIPYLQPFTPQVLIPIAAIFVLSKASGKTRALSGVG